MNKGLSASTLKIIAIITMVIDHISWGFFDFYSWQGYLLHIIGRFTIPIMCFFIAEGYRKTHNLRNYILRMTFFAAVSTVPFYLFFHEEYAYRQNIIFDYLLALLLLSVVDSKKLKLPAKISLSILLVLTSAVVGGWPVMPMLYVLIFYYGKNFKQQAVWFCSVTVGLVLLMMVAISLNSIYNYYPMYNSWVWWDKSYFLGFMLALPLIRVYNGEKGDYPFGRYFFFIFYPAHFLVLYGAKMIIRFFGSYYLYIGLQWLCLGLVIAFIIRVMYAKSSRAQNACILFSVSGVVYLVAFYIETTATTLDVAYSAVTMEYLGETGTFIGLTIFLSRFANFYVNRWFYLLEGIWLGTSVVLVHTARDNHIFYNNISMDYSGEFPRLVLDYGAGFYAFITFLGVIFVIGVIKMIQAFKKGSVIERKRISLISVGICFPWIATLIRYMGFTGGYEVSFLGIIIGSLCLIQALLKYGYFDSVQQAVTNVIYKSNEGLLVLDNNRNVLYYNSIVKKIFPGVTENNPISRDKLLENIIGKYFDKEGKLVERDIQDTVEVEDRIFEIKTEPILEYGFTQGYMVRVFDYTIHYRSIEKLRISAHIDALTGLYDRELFKQKITAHLVDNGIGALYMVDIDFFKSVNDSFGHIVGDEALIALSNAIRTVFAGGNIFCRVGGDEFMMFVKNTEDEELLISYAEKLNEVYKENARNVASELSSSLSVGIVKTSSIPEATKSDELFEKLYIFADKALYHTKENGKNGYCIYSVALEGE
ncbi:MAG: TraX family protein [Lachnospira sp.]